MLPRYGIIDAESNSKPVCIAAHLGVADVYEFIIICVVISATFLLGTLLSFFKPLLVQDIRTCIRR